MHSNGLERLVRPVSAPAKALLTSVLIGVLAQGASVAVRSAETLATLPPAIRVVLENTRPLQTPRDGRLPLFVLPISQALAGVNDTAASEALRDLNRRGLAYTVAWNPSDRTNSFREALRIGRMQQTLGMEVAVDATACLSSFFDGTTNLWHVDGEGRRYAETSFGGQLGCPFTLKPRIPFIAERVDSFVREYERAGIKIDFVCADWEVDGPIEWNDAWASSKKCRRCREAMPDIDDFRQFQRRLRSIRAELEREAFAQPIKRAFPKVLVGNYGVHPHEGYRYWYDYFEKEVIAGNGVPLRADGRAHYREWADEFRPSGYTFANPVLYTWYRLFDWYDFADPDYHWFYNLLLEGSSAGRSTPESVPLIPFVHWTTTDPPKAPAPNVRQFSPERYQELLWHLLLRGHDSFFLWCTQEELAAEVTLLHPVYADSLKYRKYLDQGQPVTFEVPKQPGVVISGMRLGNRVLVERSDFGKDPKTVTIKLPYGRGQVTVPPATGVHELPIDAVVKLTRTP